MMLLWKNKVMKPRFNAYNRKQSIKPEKWISTTMLNQFYPENWTSASNQVVYKMAKLQM